MLGKILFTLVIIVLAFFFVRQRHLAEGTDKPKPTNLTDTATGTKSTTAAKSEFASDLRFAAWMTVILMVGLGGILYYFRWQDEHEVLTVTLHRDNQAAPISYQVYRYQLQDRSFVTIDGTTVTVAASERMEVLGLEQ